jgi:CRISPR/Cas system-associated exonuclease Cas4 (RecB family)
MMMDFLERVAYRLHEQYGGAMDRQVIVLPSRRAGLYLSRYLARLSDRPQWSPLMQTPGELFSSFSDLRPAEQEEQIFSLYRIYKSMFDDHVSFDDFWSWGEIIINDFNDIDLYLASAEKLYSNISDLKEIDMKFGGLTEEQTEIIRSFWKSFMPGSEDSAARTKFRSVWQKLGPLYDSFRSSMREAGHAGDGMLCRDVAERAMAGTLPVPEEKIWHIVGLNALNNCEKVLFRYLRGKGQARFYWDDEHFFMRDPDHRAAAFMRENNRMFGNELGSASENLPEAPSGRWTIADTPSDSAQARMLPDIMKNCVIDPGGDPADTAVVLADEKLLLPVLTSLPESAGEVNVTMGYPFRFTPLYSFLRQLMALIRTARVSDGKTTFRGDAVITLLRHQYFRLLAGGDGEKIVSEIIEGNMIRIEADFLVSRLPLKMLFTVPADGSGLPRHLVAIMQMIESASFRAQEEGSSMSVDREYLRMAMNGTGKLANLIETYEPDLKTDTSIRFLDRVFRKLMVPFSGEPLRGIQVMGVLETRALEFRNIIFLSLNEGIFPGQSYDNTFIPYNIRRAFGLPTINEHESIWSYYFFRLLRKPEQGWFMYNSTAQGLTTGEMSRYLIQISFSPLFRKDFRSVHISVGRSRLLSETLPKTPEHNRQLISLYGNGSEKDKYLSPSAINTWVNCRMRFYYRYVCGMPEEEELEKDIDQRRFGNILHSALQHLYEPLRTTGDASAQIARLSSDRELVRQTVIAAAMKEMRWNRETLMAGKGVIIIDVLERYVTDLMKYDAETGDLAIVSLEDNYSGTCMVSTGQEDIRIRIGGRADRVDLTGGAIRVVDYKTGSPKRDAVKPEDLFDEEKDKRNDALLQAMLYCHLIREKHPGKIVIPAVYWVQQISSDDFTPYVPVAGIDGPGADHNSWLQVMDSFAAGMNLTLNRIFSGSEDYIMTPFERRCSWCPYRVLCRR